NLFKMKTVLHARWPVGAAAPGDRAAGDRRAPKASRSTMIHSPTSPRDNSKPVDLPAGRTDSPQRNVARRGATFSFFSRSLADRNRLPKLPLRQSPSRATLRDLAQRLKVGQADSPRLATISAHLRSPFRLAAS